MIVTSREQVKIAAAALHTTRHIPLREGLPEDEAVALLRDLDPQGMIGLREAPEEDLRRAARLTRGIPRALEILAGILHEDPTASLPRLLADENLFGEQVVEQLVAAGYSHLGAPERQVMEALAVFDRPVEETAVAYLLHPWFPGMDVRGSLQRLVRSYFVSANRFTGEYSLHPLDREYAYRQLPEGTETKVESSYNWRNLELRAVDFYASIGKPESEWKSIEDLEPQLAEFEHRVRAGDFDSACHRLESIDFNYLSKWGYYARIVGLREKLIGQITDLRLRMENLGRLGRAHQALGQIERAIQFYKDALDISRDIGDRWGESIQLGNLGSAYSGVGQIEQAIVFHEQGLRVAREVDNRQEEAGRLGSLGSAYRSLGQIEQAIEFHVQAIAIEQEIGDRRWEGIQIGELGLSYHALGQVGRAIQSYDHALVICREMNDRQWESIYLSRLGSAYLTKGQVERAINYYEEALAITHEIGDHRGESFQLLGLGQALLTAGKVIEAQRRCEQALAVAAPATSYQAATTLGIVLLHLHDRVARETFMGAATRCQALLTGTASWHAPSFALAAALVGQAVCDPRWEEGDERFALLVPALAEYRRALEITSAPGIVQDAIRNLELVRAAGVEGLEPVFELLENAEYEPGLPQDLPDILEETA